MVLSFIRRDGQHGRPPSLLFLWTPVASEGGILYTAVHRIAKILCNYVKPVTTVVPKPNPVSVIGHVDAVLQHTPGLSASSFSLVLTWKGFR